MGNWKRVDDAWWYREGAGDSVKWRRLAAGTPELPIPPPGWFVRVAQSMSSDGPIPPLLIGVIAALIALVLAIEIVPKDAPTVLAPVLTAIGAFAGHAAGHAAARQK